MSQVPALALVCAMVVVLNDKTSSRQEGWAGGARVSREDLVPRAVEQYF